MPPDPSPDTQPDRVPDPSPGGGPDGVPDRLAVRLRSAPAPAGPGAPLLLLLHGLGATADVWRPLEPVLREEWPGPWLAPDLPGHGGSAPLPAYSVDALAAALVAGLGADGALDGEPPVVVLGHSLGGAVALALAGHRYAVRVAGVVGVGVKTAWSDEEVARGAALAARAPRLLPDRASAVERHLRLAGLEGLVGPDDPAAGADAAVVEADGGWRPVLDQAALGVSLAGLAPGLVAAATAPVLLVRGERDPMAGPQDAAALGVPGLELPGLGHCPHVEDPGALWSAVRAALLRAAAPRSRAHP